MGNPGFNKIKQVSLLQDLQSQKQTNIHPNFTKVDAQGSVFPDLFSHKFSAIPNLENFFLLNYDTSSNSQVGSWSQYILPLIFERSTTESKSNIVKDSETNSNLEFPKYFLRKIDPFLYGSRRNKISIL